MGANQRSVLAVLWDFDRWPADWRLGADRFVGADYGRNLSLLASTATQPAGGIQSAIQRLRPICAGAGGRSAEGTADLHIDGPLLHFCVRSDGHSNATRRVPVS